MNLISCVNHVLSMLFNLSLRSGSNLIVLVKGLPIYTQYTIVYNSLYITKMEKTDGAKCYLNLPTLGVVMWQILNQYQVLVNNSIFVVKLIQSMIKNFIEHNFKHFFKTLHQCACVHSYVSRIFALVKRRYMYTCIHTAF